jgi:transposase
LFALKQALQSGKDYQGQITKCDGQIEMVLRDLTFNNMSEADPGKQKKTLAAKEGRTVNAPCILELHHMLVNLYQGNDLAVLPAYTDDNMLQIVSDVGTDLSK